MNVGVFGVGHVGLVTSVCLAEVGHSVVAVDKDPEIIGRLAAGIPTLYEPGLPALLQSNLRTGRLTFTRSAAEAVRASEVVFLCVGTPPLPDGRSDLSQMEEAIRSVVSVPDGSKVIVEKSTVPVMTAGSIEAAIRRLTGGNGGYDLASNPEFLREGSAIHDFLHPDRIVIGADSERARGVLLGLYQPDFSCPILVTSVQTAELIKQAANAFLATKISFINMVSDLCEKVGADVSVVARGIGLDSRIGPHFLNAGLGYGGSCFSKDLRAFVWSAAELGVDFALLREVERINESRVERVLKKLDQALWVTRDKTVGVLGVAFKANTDDVRNAPSLRIVPRLRNSGVRLRIYDPQATDKLALLWPPDDRLSYVQSSYEAARGAHALLILTDWEEFRSLDLHRLRTVMRTPIIVDGRNLFEPARVCDSGFEYYSLGRGDAALPVAAAAV